MTLAEARKILGLGPDDDPHPFMAEFKEARDRIAEMVRTAPNETLATRYQQGLVDFDRALAAVREHLEATGAIPKTIDSAIPAPAPETAATAPVKEVVSEPKATEPVSEPKPTETKAVEVVSETKPPEVKVMEPASEEPTVAETLIPPPLPPSTEPPGPPAEPIVFGSKKESPDKPEAPAATEPLATAPLEETPRKTRSSAKAVWLLTIVLFATAGGLYYLKLDEDHRLQIQATIASLETHGAAHIENRRWPEATKAFDEIEALSPNSEIVKRGRLGIEAGMTEEQNQFVGYLTGQARASLEAGRWDEATAAAKQVLAKFPKEKESADILLQIEKGRAAESDKVALATAREQLGQRKWDEAIAAANLMLSKRPDNEDAKTLLTEANAAKEKAAADMTKAKALLQQARDLDKGQFDQAILDLLREASSLAPEDQNIKAFVEKIAAYSRTLRVPGDYATPAEALANARDRDRIILAAGTWEGPLVVNASIDLQGAGAETTLVQCAATKGNAITLSANAKGTRITGISFRHESFDPGEERFSAALVRGIAADFADCRFYEASGHGMAVIEGGHATVSRCKFSDNGWDGIAASGPGSLLEVRESESIRNFGHGIESWDGAAVILTGNRCEENSRNGIHADNGGGSVTIEKNQLTGNREFGLVLSSAGSGKVSENVARGNLLGGFVIRSTASAVPFTSNQSNKNDGPGLVLDIGLLAATYADNVNQGNGGQQVIVNANLSAKEEIPEEKPANPTTPPNPPKALPVIEEE